MKTSLTGLLLNLSAICPYRWKIDLISCRAYNFCCNWYSLTKETEFLRDLFRQNGYPGVTFENCVKCFVDSKFIPCKKQTQQQRTRVVLVFATERKAQKQSRPPSEEGELRSAVFCTYNFRV